MSAWQVSVIKGFYQFVCPDRQAVRAAFWVDSDTIRPMVKQAILEHLETCPRCAYETLPTSQSDTRRNDEHDADSESGFQCRNRRRCEPGSHIGTES